MGDTVAQEILLEGKTILWKRGTRKKGIVHFAGAKVASPIVFFKMITLSNNGLVTSEKLEEFAIELGRKVAVQDRKTYGGLKNTLRADIITALGHNEPFLPSKL